MRLDLALEQHGLEEQEVDGRICYDPQTFRDVEPEAASCPSTSATAGGAHAPGPSSSSATSTSSSSTSSAMRTSACRALTWSRRAPPALPRRRRLRLATRLAVPHPRGPLAQPGLWSHLYNHGQTVRIPVYLQAMQHVKAAIARIGDPNACSSHRRGLGTRGPHRRAPSRPRARPSPWTPAARTTTARASSRLSATRTPMGSTTSPWRMSP